MSESTDKELAASVRDLFSALRRSISVAEKAGLRVEFCDQVEELLDYPDQSLPTNYVRIVRPL